MSKLWAWLFCLILLIILLAKSPNPPKPFLGFKSPLEPTPFEAPSYLWWFPWAPLWSGSNSILSSQPCEQTPCHRSFYWSHRWCFYFCSFGWAWCRWENFWLLTSSCSSHPKASSLVDGTCWTCDLLDCTWSMSWLHPSQDFSPCFHGYLDRVGQCSCPSILPSPSWAFLLLAWAHHSFWQWDHHMI